MQSFLLYYVLVVLNIVINIFLIQTIFKTQNDFTNLQIKIQKNYYYVLIIQNSLWFLFLQELTQFYFYEILVLLKFYDLQVFFKIINTSHLLQQLQVFFTMYQLNLFQSYCFLFKPINALLFWIISSIFLTISSVIVIFELHYSLLLIVMSIYILLNNFLLTKFTNIHCQKNVVPNTVLKIFTSPVTFNVFQIINLILGIFQIIINQTVFLKVNFVTFFNNRVQFQIIELIQNILMIFIVYTIENHFNILNLKSIINNETENEKVIEF